jgi:predicted DNA-binding WGR domain protein
MRLEFRKGTSQKFWEIDVRGASIVTRWGRLGTDGQEKTKKLASPTAAKAAHDALVREKTAKGYKPAAFAKAAAKSASELVPHLRMILKRLDKADGKVRDRLGGAPNRWSDQEPWPTCGSCQQPLHFVLQLLGEKAGGRARIGKAAALQLFVCHNEGDCEFYALRWNANHVALRSKPLASGLAERPGGTKSAVADDPLRFARSIEYKDGADDAGALDDLEDDERAEKAHERGFVDKLYGVPVAANEPEDVKCKKCRKRLAFLGQVLSADDWFIYYLHACESGHEVTFHGQRA